MLRIQDLNKAYGSEILFEEASLQMSPRERLGLVGRNGHGKTTLFRMILGEEHPDDGIITLPQNYRIGHLAQHLNFTQPTVLDEGCLGLSEEERYDHYKVERILFGLGFTEEDMGRPPAVFSGGFQIRLNLAKVLVSNPNLLLLDEPTNYLDIVSLRWIIGFLRGWKNELILISHDREFMDSVTTHTAAIHRHKIRKIQGNTGKLYGQIAQEEEIHEKTRLNEEKQRKHIETFVNRFRAQATKASAVQSRVKLLEKMPARQKLSRIANLDFSFHYAPFAAKVLMEVQDLSFHFEPKNPLISDFNLTIGSKDRIAVIGKNGKGKSTLLNLMAHELTPQRGDIRSHTNMNLGYFGQTNINRLNLEKTVEEEISQSNPDLNRTAVRTICGIMMFGGERAEKKISVLSGGERSRVLLGKILAAPTNLLLLDEPTNHLDMQSIESLVESLQDFNGAVVIVTHSEMILREVATKLVVFQHGKVTVFNGSYDEFLEKVGWDEEKEEASPLPNIVPLMPEMKTPPPQGKNKKEARKKRSHLLMERAKTLNPLKEEITALENEICRLETELASLNNQLIDASIKSQVDQFVTLSKTLKEVEKMIDKHFGRLEVLTKRYEEKIKKYEDSTQKI
ncbi:MAG: ABC transporter ATP-binding protein [Deltaproteobacteria bacterium RIFCSPLOWO2_02_FULL_50_16]|nr:MAG: ABC transporter ATP-binding protein [Deltaproteobacteria bacterium RIFCSPHIGHO2_02_FULL_50_15]OGQ56922.1 MAG: ABC transporter ATP-binding protein [Deltaproteobacteria bacterium RIFCSPLOWO2_02_FULL_50_16]OGQ67556.1 MAG: ABC transporter ATP-binding protein [Deltaproteobacteria bacterium RIFCSPLOWO2_12_FULL_50_11]